MDKKQKNNSSKLLVKILTIICIGIFISAGYGLYDVLKDYYDNRKMLTNVQETYKNALAEEDSNQGGNSSSDDIRAGFDELLEQNENVVGWLTVDGTNIDYPVLQAKDNIHYLDTNYDDDKSRAGSIFMDYRNDVESENKNTVIYGHRMKDGSMFKDLTKFLDEEFAKNHSKFQFDTLYDSYEAEVFAVYNTLTDFDYIETDFNDEGQFAHLVQDIQDESKFDFDVDVDEDNQIITLSTCDYDLDEQEGRLVVQAKLTKES